MTIKSMKWVTNRMEGRYEGDPDMLAVVLDVTRADGERLRFSSVAKLNDELALMITQARLIEQALRTPWILDGVMRRYDGEPR